MILIPAKQSRWAACRFPWPGRKWVGAGLPHAERGLHADHVFQTEFGDSGSKPAVGAISGIGYDHTTRYFLLDGIADLIECDLRFCLKLDLVRNAGRFPTLFVTGPHLWQV